MQKQKIIKYIIIVIMLFLLIPTTNRLKDGGTVEWKSLTYKITKVHSLNKNQKTEYDDGIIIEILGLEIFNNVNK